MSSVAGIAGYMESGQQNFGYAPAGSNGGPPFAGSVQASMGKGATLAANKKVGFRRGKWTSEEEAYANRLIHEFKLGMLPLTDGTTLRTFLSKLLNCDPMRISKKFVGQNCIGKQVFRRRPSELDKLTEEQLDKTRRDLSELERLFLERVAQTNRSQRASGGVVKSGRLSYMGDGTPPWMMPPENEPSLIEDASITSLAHSRGSDSMQGGGPMSGSAIPIGQSFIKSEGFVGTNSSNPGAPGNTIPTYPPSGGQGASSRPPHPPAMRQNHHPHVAPEAAAHTEDSLSRVKMRKTGDGNSSSNDNYYDASMLGASNLQSSYTEKGGAESKSGNDVVSSSSSSSSSSGRNGGSAHQAMAPGGVARVSASGGFHPFRGGTFPDGTAPAPPAAVQAPRPGAQASANAAPATRGGNAAITVPAAAVVGGPATQHQRASRRTRRTAQAQTTVQAPAEDTGGVSSGSEGRMGGLKRINSLELFDFSFDEGSPTAKNAGDAAGAFSDQEIPYI